MGASFKLTHKHRMPDIIADSSQHYSQEHAESQNYLGWERPQKPPVQLLAPKRDKLKITVQNMRPGQTESTSHFNKDTHQWMKPSKPGHYPTVRGKHGPPFWYIFHMERALVGPIRHLQVDTVTTNWIFFISWLMKTPSSIQAHTVWLFLLLRISETPEWVLSTATSYFPLSSLLLRK